MSGRLSPCGLRPVKRQRCKQDFLLRTTPYRKLYVACTRARQDTIAVGVGVSCWPERGAAGLNWLPDWLPGPGTEALYHAQTAVIGAFVRPPGTRTQNLRNRLPRDV